MIDNVREFKRNLTVGVSSDYSLNAAKILAGSCGDTDYQKKAMRTEIERQIECRTRPNWSASRWSLVVSSAGCC